jgi:hypothetical protein
VSALQLGTETEAQERHLFDAIYIKLLHPYKREIILTSVRPGSGRSANGAILEG